MKAIVLIILSIILTACQKEEVAQPDYTNYLIIDNMLISSLFYARYYEHTNTINLKPENGMVVLRQKHDSIYEGYMIVNNVPFHIDSSVCVYAISERIIGYAYGEMKLSDCQLPDQFKEFKIKYNLLK